MSANAGPNPTKWRCFGWWLIPGGLLTTKISLSSKITVTFGFGGSITRGMLLEANFADLSMRFIVNPNCVAMSCTVCFSLNFRVIMFSRNFVSIVWACWAAIVAPGHAVLKFGGSRSAAQCFKCLRYLKLLTNVLQDGHKAEFFSLRSWSSCLAASYCSFSAMEGRFVEKKSLRKDVNEVLIVIAAYRIVLLCIHSCYVEMQALIFKICLFFYCFSCMSIDILV